MLRHMLKQPVRKEGGGGRGFRAPALLLFARASLFVRRLGRASRGYVLAGTGMVAAAVVFVSLLSWLAPDSDRPIDSPLEVIERVAGGVLEQVDEQVTAVLGTDGESVLRSVSEDVTAGTRIPWARERLRQIATDRSASAGPAPVPAAVRVTPNTAPPAAQEGPSSSPTATNESLAPQATREPSSREASPPISTRSLPGSIGETVPPAEEDPALTTSDPALPPPPATEAPSPAAGEPPAVEEPSTPPVEEPLPAAEEPPPTTDEPAGSTADRRATSRNESATSHASHNHPATTQNLTSDHKPRSNSPGSSHASKSPRHGYARSSLSENGQWRKPGFQEEPFWAAG